jgi:hypothetical protein
MAEANLNLRVDTTQAQKNLELVTDKVIDQEAQIAKLRISLVEAEQDLANFNFKGFQGQLTLEKQIDKTKQQIAKQKEELRLLKVEQKAEARVLRNANKVRTAGTIKAAQFNETLLKNRDITSGLNKLTGGYSLQIQSLGKTFLSLGRGIKIAAGSLSIFSKALIATGIGAIVVAVGLLAANFDKVTKALGGVTKEQEKLLNDAKELVTAQEDQFKNLTSTEETLKRQGKTEKEIRDLKIQQTNETITALEAQLTQQKTIKDEQLNIANRNKAILKGILQFVSAPLMLVLKGIDKAVQFFGGESNLADGFTESVAGLIFDPDKIAEEADKGIEETVKKLRELKNRRDGFLNQEKAEEDAETEKANQKMLKDIKEAVDNEAKRQESIEAVREKYKKLNQDREDLTFQQKAERQRKRALAELKLLDATEDQKAELIKYYQGVVSDAIVQDEQLRADKIKEVEEQKRAIREKTFNTAVQLAGEDSRLGKAILVAKTILAAKENLQEVKKTLIKAKQASIEATVDGAKAGSAVAQGSAETLKVGFPQNIPLIIAYAAQAVGIISAVKAAVSKTKSVASSAGASGGGGSVGIDVPQIQTAAPSFNIVGSAPENQLAQTISAQTGKPIRTYVVAGDVTTAQGLERNIVEESSLG